MNTKGSLSSAAEHQIDNLKHCGSAANALTNTGQSARCTNAMKTSIGCELITGPPDLFKFLSSGIPGRV